MSERKRANQKHSAWSGGRMWRGAWVLRTTKVNP
jgi:hypothetical protein